MSVMLAERQSGRLTTKATVHFARAPRGRKELREGALPPPAAVPVGRVPRITRLMALAIRFERLVATGAVRDYAEIARLGYVTRARVTQIMNLLNLAPDIQEDILFLPPVEHGRDPIKEWQIRPITLVPDWRKQRRMWRTLLRPRSQTDSENAADQDSGDIENRACQPLPSAVSVNGSPSMRKNR